MTPIEETKNMQFYLDGNTVLTKSITSLELENYRKQSDETNNIPISFICWECSPTHKSPLKEHLKNYNLICTKCGKKFFNSVDVTIYEVIK